MKKLELQGDVDALEKRKSMILGELKQSEQKAIDLKSANEFNESRLKNTDNLLTERKVKCDELQAQQKKFHEEVNSLESKIKEYNIEYNYLQERVSLLRGDEKNLEIKVVKLETREEELRKLNSEFSNVIANLKSGSTEFEKHQNNIKTGLQNAKQTLEDATQNMRNSIIKFDQEVANLKNASFDLKNDTEQSTNKLKTRVDQLSNVANQSDTLLVGMTKELSSFQQKQVAMVEAQNKFEMLLKQIESSAKDFITDKSGLQEIYKKLKEETFSAIKKIEELRDVNLKLEREFDGLKKAINSLPRDEESKATKQ
jgi:chromosome segregation ATPase